MKTVKICRSEISRDHLSYLFALAFAGKNKKKTPSHIECRKKDWGIGPIQPEGEGEQQTGGN